MRTICGHKPGELVKFVPEAFGNRNDQDPVTIWYRSPSEHERRVYMTFGQSLIIQNGIVTTNSDDHVERQARMVEGLVEKVENYTGRAGPIKNGSDLAKHGESEIVSEVYLELTSASVLTPDVEKKSDGS